jgi:predicted homoserine dehydrogenase-like protein
VKLLHPVKAHEVVRWEDVAIDAANDAVRFRREMERVFVG